MRCRRAPIRACYRVDDIKIFQSLKPSEAQQPSGHVHPEESRAAGEPKGKRHRHKLDQHVHVAPLPTGRQLRRGQPARACARAGAAPRHQALADGPAVLIATYPSVAVAVSLPRALLDASHGNMASAARMRSPDTLGVCPLQPMSSFPFAFQDVLLIGARGAAGSLSPSIARLDHHSNRHAEVSRLPGIFSTFINSGFACGRPGVSAVFFCRCGKQGPIAQCHIRLPTERSEPASLLHSLQAGAQALIDNRQLKIISSRDAA